MVFYKTRFLQNISEISLALQSIFLFRSNLRDAMIFGHVTTEDYFLLKLFTRSYTCNLHFQHSW